ncbi:hypothetical protein BP6252_13936 [Coleophoma cylindrospora]|uniref:Uncharacterized protein n=1 Tax=Coleophoma cylindrospora TaxID=1849047 RepID=A0A3D8Q597_9HELO|nr:hypothetical protein BP6252_13936 [Coleophoma cylindrospora]
MASDRVAYPKSIPWPSLTESLASPLSLQSQSTRKQPATLVHGPAAGIRTASQQQPWPVSHPQDRSAPHTPHGRQTSHPPPRRHGRLRTALCRSGVARRPHADALRAHPLQGPRRPGHEPKPAYHQGRSGGRGWPESCGGLWGGYVRLGRGADAGQARGNAHHHRLENPVPAAAGERDDAAGASAVDGVVQRAAGHGELEVVCGDPVLHQGDWRGHVRGDLRVHKGDGRVGVGGGVDGVSGAVAEGRGAWEWRGGQYRVGGR